MPSNCLTLTNCVYLSLSIHAFLFDALRPESNGPPLVLMGPHAYVAEASADVPKDTIALNGLQRRFAQLSLANKVEVRPCLTGCDILLANHSFFASLLEAQ